MYFLKYFIETACVLFINIEIYDYVLAIYPYMLLKKVLRVLNYLNMDVIN